MEENKLIDD